MAQLTNKQKRFCDEYLIDLNVTQAAIRSGYSKKYAMAHAYELLDKKQIKDYLDQQLKKIENEKIADASEVMKYLTAVMRGELDEEVIVVEGEGEGCSSAAKVKKQVGAKERNKAAELLGKRYRLFTDKMEVTGELPVVISGGDKLED